MWLKKRPLLRFFCRATTGTLCSGSSCSGCGTSSRPRRHQGLRLCFSCSLLVGGASGSVGAGVDIGSRGSPRLQGQRGFRLGSARCSSGRLRRSSRFCRRRSTNCRKGSPAALSAARQPLPTHLRALLQPAPMHLSPLPTPCNADSNRAATTGWQRRSVSAAEPNNRHKGRQKRCVMPRHTRVHVPRVTCIVEPMTIMVRFFPTPCT
mmetsp:Transcript_12678/g.40885  ORF Transcript_12678/g.40885 Transcript_12678/m.40885 type:complete len:207 (+) Transcript_12678:280-900(+)